MAAILSRMRTLILDGRSLGWKEIRAAGEGPVRVRVRPSARKRVRASRAALTAAFRSGRKLYGINTGFGRLADVRIDATDACVLQRNLVLSHAVGVGPAMPLPEVRRLVLFRINALVRGNSGCTAGLVEYLCRMLERDVLPVIPEQGSVGASGDLAPLAHLGACMLGEGRAVWRGRELSARSALRRAGLRPYGFKEKEGLSLINGTQFTLALLATGVLRAERLVRIADVAGAMTVEGLMGSVKPFEAKLHEARPHPGQARVAGNLRKLLRRSRIVQAHARCPRVQDHYSLRCMPQIHGAVREVIDWVRGIVLREANGSSDNPLVFEDGTVLPGGNFHGMLLAHAADALTAAMTTIGNVSERRIESMMNPEMSGLAPFLAVESGLNSGFMAAQVVAAALAAENRTLCYPAAVANIPTSAGKEDMVSMSPIGTRHLRTVLDHVETILAIETICAAQAIDFRKPLLPGAGVAAAHRAVRSRVQPLRRDRYMKPDVDRMRRAIADGFLEAVEGAVGRLD